MLLLKLRLLTPSEALLTLSCTVTAAVGWLVSLSCSAAVLSLVACKLVVVVVLNPPVVVKPLVTSPAPAARSAIRLLLKSNHWLAAGSAEALPVACFAESSWLQLRRLRISPAKKGAAAALAA